MSDDLGCTTSIEVIRDRISLDGQSVLDIGCGDMTFSRVLADNGARVLALDPDPVQADVNRAAASTPELQFVEASSEALPVPDRSVDGVFFSFSLHHVPASLYAETFAEVFRVLRPGGYLCVIEPMDGPLIQIMRFFHDEERVRAEAQDALIRFAVPAFETHSVFRYFSYVQHESFDAFADRCSRRTFNPGYTEADVRRPEVREAFERLGAPDYRFASPKQMMLLQGLRTA